MRKSRFSEEPIIGILKRVEAGQPIAEVCRELGVSDATDSRWKAQYGGAVRGLRGQSAATAAAGGGRESQAQPGGGGSHAGQPRLEGHCRKKLVTPTAQRAAVGYLQQTYPLSERRACRLSGAHRTMIRYRRRVKPDEAGIRDRLRVLAGERPRWGYRRLHGLLKREVGVINHKRGYRLYRAEGLLMRRRKRHQVARPSRSAQTQTWKRGEAGSMDFMQDVLVDGRRFRTLNILDLVTRECLALEVDTSLPGQRVTRVLDQLVAYYGAPKQITVDNGPECAGQALDAWAYAHGVMLDFIEPGKPTQNAHIESFNGRFRDDCLNLHWFGSLAHARTIIHAWKEDDNTQRPHSALQQQTPSVYAQSLAT